MRITDDELAREVEALKSHRRHSVNRPVLDPDLPDLAAAYGGGQELLSPERERRGYNLVDDGAVPTRSPSSSSSTSSLSPRKSYSNGRAHFTARRRGQGADDLSGSETTMGSPTRLSPILTSTSGDAFDSRGLTTSPTSINSISPSSPKDPTHLFWVPASVHPEISPTDFRNFIKEHAARAVTQHEGQDDAVVAQDTLPPLAVGDSPIAQRLNSVRRQQQQQQDRQHPASDARGTLIGRSTSLSRRGSTLRRQYQPEQDSDDTEDDKVPRPLQRNRSGLSRGTYGLPIPNLTIDDLQRLEAAAEEASQSQDPAMLRSVLRRTLSLNTAPDLDTIDAMPAETVEDPDAPIIVPKPGQILRRAARTKMRKASGDAIRGNLAARRRAPRTSTDVESAATAEGSRAWELQQSNSEDMERRHSGHSELSSGADDDSSAGDGSSRPVSTEAADSIVDAYSRDSYQSDVSQRSSATSVVDSVGSDTGAPSASRLRAEPDSLPMPPRTPTQDSYAALPSTQPALDGAAFQPTTSQHAAPGTTSSSKQIKPIAVSHLPPVRSFEKTLPLQQQHQQVPRPASAESQGAFVAQESTRRDAQPVPSAKPPVVPTATSQQQQQQRQYHPHPPQFTSPPSTSTSNKHKEKDRKGAFGLSWFGLGKDDEDDRKDSQRKREKHEKRERKEREREEKDKEESSSSSFLGALFGKKKGQDEPSQHGAPRTANGQLTAGSLLERNEMYGKGGAYNYSRYPIHIERAVYRLSHIKLANPRRPLYEQVLISNLMFWYLSIINRSNQGQYAQPQQQHQQGQVQQGNSNTQGSEQNGAAAAGQSPGSGGPNGYGPASSHAIDTASAYDGMDTSSSSPDSEDSSGAEQWTQSNNVAAPGGSSGGGNGAALKQKRTGLVKPNRAPAGSSRGRAAEIPMKQPGYGMQHRQIDDDLKTMGSHSGQLGGGGSGGFVVGQVVDVKALQANAPYRLMTDSRTDGGGYHDQAKSATVDYLRLGHQFDSEPLWDRDTTQTSSDGTQTSDDHRRVSEHGEQKHSTSPNRPYRSEAERERAWLGMRNSSGRMSPTHGYGSLSQQSTDGIDAHERREQTHHQGRSLSLGGISAMTRTGDWDKQHRPTDRSRKSSMGHMSPSTSQAMSISSSNGSISTIDEGSGTAYGGMISSTSSPAFDSSSGGREEQRPYSTGAVEGGRFDLPKGSNAMLDAARLSQSRRR